MPSYDVAGHGACLAGQLYPRGPGPGKLHV